MLDVVLLKSMESPHSPHGLHGDSWRVPMESSWSLWERVGECKVLTRAAAGADRGREGAQVGGWAGGKHGERGDADFGC